MVMVIVHNNALNTKERIINIPYVTETKPKPILRFQKCLGINYIVSPMTNSTYFHGIPAKSYGKQVFMRLPDGSVLEGESGNG